MFECPICGVEYENNDEGFTFPRCLHSFCKNCLKQQFEIKIKEQDIDPSIFKCSCCEKSFDPSLIKEFISQQMYNMYCENSLKNNQIYGLQDYEILINCYNEKCNEKFIIWKDAEYLTCPTCKQKFCGKCHLEFHEGITCQQQQNKCQDQIYFDMKKNLKLARCPHCLRICEKTEGCNYMTCICKKNFCFQCDIPLVSADHTTHFEKNDPYNSPCRVKQDGKWVDKKDARPEVLNPIVPEKQKIEQKVDNQFPCPGCGSVDSDITHLQLFDKVAHCNSMKCSNRAYCLECKKVIPLQNIDQHYNQQMQCKFK